MRRKPTVILDFDGTLTDVWKEARPFSTIFKTKLCKLLDISHPDLEKKFTSAVRIIQAHPGNFGWERNGVIVAPAVVDPYILHRSVATIIIEEINYKPRSNETTDELLDRMFTESYQHTDTVFRSGAEELLLFLQNICTCIVVTNSDPTIVEKKLITLLGMNHGLILRGFAKKYDLDPTWHEVPETMQPKGFPRPIYLRRKAYGDILQSIGQVDLVIGDIYELDLALPDHWNIPTILVLSEQTPHWEKQYYQSHPRGNSVNSLNGIIDTIKTRLKISP